MDITGQNNNFTDDDIEFKSSPTKQNLSKFSGEIFVRVEFETARYIHNYCYSDTSQELAGVLLGNYYDKSGQYQVFIEAAVEARYTEAQRGSVTFTHKSWDYINQIRDDKYPHYKVVGWFHTHPGFGIFLSGHDKFIHQNFFNLPWQVAYVVDPLAGKHGFFGWRNNNLEIISFEGPPTPQPVKKAENVTKKGKTPAFPYGRLLIAALFTGLLVLNGYFYLSSLELDQELKEAKTIIGKQEQTLFLKEKEIGALSEEISFLEEERHEVVAMPEPEDKIEEQQFFYEYKVKEGDQLWLISKKYLGDATLYPVLAGLNDIDNPNIIEAGQKILIPSNIEMLD